MPSTFYPSDAAEPAAWRAAGLRYHSLGWHLRQRFGSRAWKVTVDAGLGCPNRDGTVGHGGCIFCDPMSFSPARRSGLTSITAQLNLAVQRLAARGRSGPLIAYFQPGSNTYGPVDRLRAVYQEALDYPGVAGLAIGTRPDCLGDEVLQLLAEIAQETWLTVELGVQTFDDGVLRRIGRGHDSRTSVEAIARLNAYGIEVGVHLILGLPGEDKSTRRATARTVSVQPIHSLKVHNLYVVRDTPLADMFASGQISIPLMEDYVGWVVDLLEQVPSHVVIDRLSGDAPPDYLIAPQWCRDKVKLLATVEGEFRRRATWQGKLAPEKSS